MKELINRQKSIQYIKHRPLIFFVVIPFFIFVFYQLLIASPRYQSQSKLIVKEPDSAATMDPSFALLTGLGVSSGTPDTELVKAFIQSNDMLEYLESELSLSTHFKKKDIDFFSRLSNDASKEDFLDFYNVAIKVEIDEKSQVVSVMAQAFEPEFSHKLNNAIVKRAEWFINEIGHKLAEQQLAFVQKEHQIVNDKLRDAKTQLLNFQRQYGLLDPEAEGVAIQSIAYKLEAEITRKRAELNALRSSMSDDAPLVIQALNELKSMEEQLVLERARLTQEQSVNSTLPEDDKNLTVSMILSKFSELRINMELALTAYTSSQVSLEKSRIEAYRQLKYLVTVESPTLPEEAKYPKVTYNVSLFLVLNIMLFGIARILIATVIELRH